MLTASCSNLRGLAGRGRARAAGTIVSTSFGRRFPPGERVEGREARHGEQRIDNVGVGIYEYRLGVAHGIATRGKIPAGAPGFYPYPHWAFHPFGFVFPLLCLFLIFGLGRRVFWGRMGWPAPLAR